MTPPLSLTLEVRWNEVHDTSLSLTLEVRGSWSPWHLFVTYFRSEWRVEVHDTSLSLTLEVRGNEVHDTPLSLTLKVRGFEVHDTPLSLTLEVRESWSPSLTLVSEGELKSMYSLSPYFRSEGVHEVHDTLEVFVTYFRSEGVMKSMTLLCHLL